MSTSPDSFVKALTSNGIVFGNRGFKKQLKLNEVIRVASLSGRTGGVIRGGRERRSLALPRAHLEEMPCEQSTASQEESSRRSQIGQHRMLGFQPREL